MTHLGRGHKTAGATFPNCFTPAGRPGRLGIARAQNLWRIAIEIALEPVIEPARQARRPTVAVTDQGRTETVHLPAAAPIGTKPPLLPELHDPAIELREHGLVLLLGEPVLVQRFGFGGLEPERFRPELSHLVLLLISFFGG
jgi:hypothetical protein